MGAATLFSVFSLHVTEARHSTVAVKNAPSIEDIASALSGLSLEAIPEATVLFSAVVGSVAAKRWRLGDDVDIRLIYVLPTSSYLGIGSYWDEVEEVTTASGLDLDIVALEIEKVVRLVLKGHVPTLAWVGRTELQLQHAPSIAPLISLAKRRLAALEVKSGGVRPVCPSDFAALDRLVQRVRAGEAEDEGS